MGRLFFGIKVKKITCKAALNFGNILNGLEQGVRTDYGRTFALGVVAEWSKVLTAVPWPFMV